MTKRIFDFSVSLVTLLIISPILIVIVLLILLTDGGPIFFTQERTGLNGKAFKIYKFRTMNEKRGSDGHLLPAARRVTLLGHLLRKTSLDELPAFINVIKGNMSLVGPRPLIHEDLDTYTEKQKERHNVKPGITGWAQINGRNNISWEMRFELDLWYVENQSFYLDLKILLLTIKTVLLCEGAHFKDRVGIEKPNSNSKAKKMMSV